MTLLGTDKAKAKQDWCKWCGRSERNFIGCIGGLIKALSFIQLYMSLCMCIVYLC